jgi:hypothetical protein
MQRSTTIGLCLIFAAALLLVAPAVVPLVNGRKPSASFTDQFRVLFLAERGTEPDYWSGAELRGYLDAHCAASQGSHGYRFLDPDDELSNADDWERRAMALPREQVPVVICGKKNMVYLCPPSETAEKMIELLAKHGGGK